MKRIILLFAVVLSLMLTTAANAETFNVAVGTAESAGYEVSDPNIFTNLENSALKPAGWTFANPHPGPYANGAVSISDLSTPQLLDYNLIFLTNHYTTTFSNADKDKFAQWIQAGGTLWIDDCGNMNPQNFFLPFSFVSYDGYTNSGAKSVTSGNENFYFFKNIYDLTPSEISTLGNNGYSAHITGYNPADWNVLLINEGNSALVDMMWRTYGLGRIIVTADDYGCAINEQWKDEDYKLAYNIMLWAKENPQSVPEPTTMLLLGLGLIGLAGFGRKKLNRS